MQTFTFILTSLIGIAFSLLYLRRFLFNTKIHALLKLLSLIVIIGSCLHFFLGEAKPDIKIEALLGLVIGALVGIFLPSIAMRMRTAPTHLQEEPTPVFTLDGIQNSTDSSLRHPEFVNVVKGVFEKRKVIWSNAEELRKAIIDNWQSLKFSYVSSTGKPFVSSNVPQFIDELVQDLTK